MKRAVLTGASGFVGRHLAACLATRDWHLQAVAQDPETTRLALPELAAAAPWTALPDWQQVDVVFHLGGLAHAHAAAPVSELYEMNVERTLALYRHAQTHGVGHFVWLSSIKALGDVSAAPLAVHAHSQPTDAYGQSKALAERALLAEPAGQMTLSIVRPPLIYGPGVKANFLRLLRWAERGWPLPLAAANAPRSWLGVGNLLDFLLCLVDSPRARRAQIWHVRDEEETSVAAMVEQLATLLGQRIRLWRVNPGMAMRVARLLGRAELAQRLFQPLQLDVGQTRELLGWRAPHRQIEELERVVAWYRTQ